MSEVRYVFDTNVIVSAALISASVSRFAFDEARRQGTICLSPPIVAELFDVMNRKRFDRYVTIEDRMEFLAELIRTSSLHEPETCVRVCRDARDDMFLELAVSIQAACLISGDDDLLAHNPFQGIPILTPRQFLDTQSETHTSAL